MRNSPKYANKRARVLIADNHSQFAEACRGILEPEFEAVGVVLDGSKVAQAVAKLEPDVVIIDMVMPPLEGFEMGARVNATGLKTKIVYMTVAPDFDSAAEAFRRGASAYVSKRYFPDDLRIAIRHAVRDELYLSPSISRPDVSR